MKAVLLWTLASACVLAGCGDKTSQAGIDPNAPICEQSNQAYVQAAEKFPQLKKEFLQTVENNRAAVAKFGEAEMAESCKKSLEKMQRMLNK